MTIQKASSDTSIETWYIAQQTNITTRHTTASNPTHATATGYGTTHNNAIKACIRDIIKIKSL